MGSGQPSNFIFQDRTGNLFSQENLDVSPSSTPDAYDIPGVIQEAIKLPGVDDDTSDNGIVSANYVNSSKPTIHDSEANLPPPAMEPPLIKTPTEAIQPEVRQSVCIRQPTQHACNYQ